MSPSAVSIIAGASDAIPDPYSADSMASSNRKTSARSTAGTAVWARVASASDAVRPSATMFRMSAINPTRADRMARSASIDRPAARTLRASASLRSAVRRACRFRCQTTSPDLRRCAETTAIRQPTPHHKPAVTSASATTLTRSIVQFRGIGHVLKNPLCPRLDLLCPGTGERPDKVARAQATGCRYGERNRFGRDLRELLGIGIEYRDGQGGNPDSGPLRSQGILESLHFSLLAPGGILVEDLEIGGDLGICREVRRRDQVQRSAGLAAFDVERERERVTHAQRGGAGGRRQAVIADSAAECRGPRSRDFAHLHRHRGSDRDQPPAGVTASFHSVHERPFHNRRAECVRSRLLGSELAFELVDEVIDRTAIEPLPAFAPLVQAEDRQPRSFEKRAAPRRDVVEREPAAVLGEEFLEPAGFVVAGQSGRQVDPVDVDVRRAAAQRNQQGRDRGRPARGERARGA